MLDIIYKTPSGRVHSVQLGSEDSKPNPRSRTEFVLVILKSLLAGVEELLDITIINIHKTPDVKVP